MSNYFVWDALTTCWDGCDASPSKGFLPSIVSLVPFYATGQIRTMWIKIFLAKVPNNMT